MSRPGLPEALGFALEEMMNFAERVGNAIHTAAEIRREQLRIEPATTPAPGQQLEFQFVTVEPEVAADTSQTRLYWHELSLQPEPRPLRLDWDEGDERLPEPVRAPRPEPRRLDWDCRE